MLYGLDENRGQIRAEPGLTAACPCCQRELVPKCGEIKVWHWAHKDAQDCDPWWEPESYWHMSWKDLVDPKYVEVPIKGHRADILGNWGTVIELQYSAIAVEDIWDREATYERMVWLFDARDAYNEERLVVRDKGRYDSFRWKHPRQTIIHCRKPIYLDLGEDQILEVKKMIYDGRFCGWGHVWSADTFIEKFLSTRLRQSEPPQPVGVQMGMF